ncbi:MAG: hypothetical protein ACOVNZ_05815 [Crocinitomicaceae bacterium]
MKNIAKLPKSFNKQLLKYYVAQYGNYGSLNIEEKEFVLMQAHSKIYDILLYSWTLLSISTISLIIRMIIVNAY